MFWEPLPGTGERIVALVSLEPHESSQASLSAGTYSVLAPERLRAMLGRQRGNAALGVLREVADFMTQRQQAGLPVAELQAPFHGFKMGPSFVARGYSVEQLLDAAVRSVSAFGNADDLVDDEDAREAPRHTVKTAEFLKTLKRHVAGDNSDIKSRFERKMRPSSALPDLTVDYSFKHWMVQITSLPTTPKQASHAQREAQSKLYEIDLLRKSMDGNHVSPILLINEDALSGGNPLQETDEAVRMLDRLRLLAKTDGIELMGASSPEAAAGLVLALD